MNITEPIVVPFFMHILSYFCFYFAISYSSHEKAISNNTPTPNQVDKSLVEGALEKFIMKV